jgi:hypothetical protein
VANLCATVFDVAPEVFGRFFEWLGKVFDVALVRDTKAMKAKRASK